MIESSREVTDVTYDDLLIESDRNNLITKEKALRANKGRIKGNRIAINRELTRREKKCVLAEELGHYYTTAGDILDQSDTGSRKQEYRARLMAYDRLIGLVGIVDAYKHGCRSRYEIAEHLDVTEAFLQETLEAYRAKYGLCTQLADYIIYFDPLGVLELQS